MQSDDFEMAFSLFLEQRAYDKAENALFDIVRAAFLAGWSAAKGQPPQVQNVVWLLRKEKERE